MITRFMQVMFSAAENNDEELTSQVANDIETAKASEEGSGVEDDEVSYVNLGSGKVLITDKGTGEATVAEQSEEDPEQYDLEGFENDEDLEKYLHTLDGVTPDENVKTEVIEHAEDHMTGEDVISPNLEDGGLNPEAGHEGSVTEVTPDEDNEEECEDDDEEKVYSVTMTEEELNMFSEYCENLANNANTASTKVFSDPEFYAKIFSDVLDEDKPAVLGDLKIEKTDDDTIVVTDLESGDEAQVTVNEDDEFIVNDVQKELSEDEKVYSVTMTEEELNMFSEYCENLANNANTASTKVFSDPEFYAKIFSDVLDEDKPAVLGDLKIEKTDDDTIVVTDLESGDEAQVTVNEDDEFIVNDVQKELSEDEKVYSVTMTEEELNMFSEYCEKFYSDEEECEEGECDGEQYEPLFVVGIDPVNHVIVDSPVYNEEDANALAQRFAEDGVEAIEIFDCPDAARDHAVSLLGEAGITEIEQVAEPQEHKFSDVTIYTTRYFTDCTEFMFKLFSETEEDIHDTQENIEDAIKSGDQKETESEVITPIDDETAVVHDKDNDEYTKVTLTADDINTEKLTEEEADNLLDKDIEKKEDEEKEFSVVNKFFADVDAAAQQQASFAPVQAVDASQINPETGDPVNVEPTAAPAQSVEVVEDKALAAVQSIQEAANEAVLAIAEAKDAPAPGEEADLKEAQFSNTKNDTLTSWFENNI